MELSVVLYSYAPSGYKLVGVDLSQLELRCLAHYLYPFDKGAMVKELLEGDIHTLIKKLQVFLIEPQQKHLSML